MRRSIGSANTLHEAILKTLPRVIFAFILVSSLVSGCGHDLNTAQGVAEEFVDQHYVYIDIQKAKQYAVGLALVKLNEEIRLTAGQRIDVSTQKPKVNYSLLEKKESPDRASFLYEGTIRSDDGSTFTRKWLIAARKEGNQWRVSNFSESD